MCSIKRTVYHKIKLYKKKRNHALHATLELSGHEESEAFSQMLKLQDISTI